MINLNSGATILVSADHPLASQLLDEAFTYDPIGNRLTSHLSASYAYTPANRLTEDAQFTYAYDANGNRTNKTDKLTGATTTYTYDVEHQLVRVEAGGSRVDYRYDGLGRRIEKSLVSGLLSPVSVTRALYDQEDIVGLFTGANCQTHAFLHGPGIDQPLVFLQDTNANCNPFTDAVGFREPAVYLQADALGSVTSLISETSGFFRSLFLAERDIYDSFGQVTITDPAGTTIRPISVFGNPYAFTGREYDPETGLHYYRARYYDPMTGRFLQEDPILHVNGYWYANGNPTNLNDPLGLDAIVLNDSDAVPIGKARGHNGIAIGNNATGWDYYSQDGPKVGGTHRRYATAAALVAEQRGRYDNFYRIAATPEEDAAMRQEAEANLHNPYSANPWDKNRYHCGDLVNDTLEAGGIAHGTESFPYAPNDSYEQIRRNNPAGR